MDVIKKKRYSVIFRCTVPKCSYSSKRLYNLQRHEKTHGKEHWRSKRFPCPCCAYAAATRAHLRRHMGNKHPAEDISKHDLTGLAYEVFAGKQDEEHQEEQSRWKEQDEEEEEEEEDLDMDPLEMMPIKLEQPVQSKQNRFIEGPVTVLQMVTPLSQESEPQPGEIYCNVSLEGEAFRLIPVALLSADAVTQEL